MASYLDIVGLVLAWSASSFGDETFQKLLHLFHPLRLIGRKIAFLSGIVLQIVKLDWLALVSPFPPTS